MKNTTFAHIYLYMLVSIVTSFVLTSCNNDNLREVTVADEKIIDIEKITSNTQTRSDLLGNNYTNAFHCSSKSSSVIADIFINDQADEATAQLLNENNEVAYILRFKMNEIKEGKIYFTTYNENDEPIMSGTFDSYNMTYEIPTFYGNDVVTRVSAASWGCNLGMFAAGVAWSAPAAMISGGLSIGISLAYTCAAIAICDGL